MLNLDPDAAGRQSIIRPGGADPDLIDLSGMDRRLAYKNLRTGLIAGVIALVVFAVSWVVGLVY